MTANISTAFHRYFSDTINFTALNRDKDGLRRRILEKSSRLFKGIVDLHIIVSPRNAERQRSHMNIKGGDELRQILQNHPDHNFVYILAQKFTWDGLLIDRETLFHILSQHHVFPDFMDCIHAYGSKLSDDTEVWEGFHQNQQLSFTDNREVQGHYEICYNIRYMIENGRSKGSSWSLRQTSVYHRKDFGAEAETWIIIQPSKSVQNYLELETKSVLSNEESAVRRHTVILRRSVEGWREYISYIRLRLEQLDEKANFTRVGKKTYLDDYDVSLQDNQTLHKLQRKLFRARLVIEATLATVSRLRNWFEQLSAFDVLDSTIISRSTDELNDITAALVYHKKNLKGLTAYSRGTAELLQQITAYRAMTNLQSTASALETSLYLLRGIATASQLQTQSILTIAQSGSKDSLRIKTLTHIATVYLPPTLIATIFSSNLVSLKDGSRHFVISPQFWIFVVVTVSITVITHGGLLMLEKRWKKDYHI